MRKKERFSESTYKYLQTQVNDASISIIFIHDQLRCCLVDIISHCTVGQRQGLRMRESYF